ncbi:MAG: metalloregulator ArsR/SmtB family transcription factor [bacterium]|nr:metalloregulator ArsR/SmtB family transcription factor [bacterium]
MYQKLFRLQEEVFKVIANQKRLEIIQLLKNRELSVSEMIEMLGIKQANLSQHLSLLRRYGIVNARKQGLKVYYSLADKKVAQSCELIRKFLQQQNKYNSNITDLVSLDGNDLYPIVQDPVCKMRISISEAGDLARFDNKTFYFCASGCKQKFKSSPDKYLKHIKMAKKEKKLNARRS